MLAANVFLAVALASSVTAFQVTQPSETRGWTTTGPQTVAWNKVESDPNTFAIVLTDGNPANNVLLASSVDAASGTTTVQPPNGAWPASNDNWRINLVQDQTRTEAILAQSDQFEFTAGLVCCAFQQRFPQCFPQQQRDQNCSYLCWFRRGCWALWRCSNL